MLYLESGHFLGKLLLRQKDSEGARELLRPLWEYQAGLPEEKRVRLWCGELYGQSLLQCKQYKLAKEKLESIKCAQLAFFGERSPEGDHVMELLKRVCKKLDEKRQRRGGCILRRCN